jgi:hypothetical protein
MLSTVAAVDISEVVAKECTKPCTLLFLHHLELHAMHEIVVVEIAVLGLTCGTPERVRLPVRQVSARPVTLTGVIPLNCPGSIAVGFTPGSSSGLPSWTRSGRCSPSAVV